MMCLRLAAVGVLGVCAFSVASAQFDDAQIVALDAVSLRAELAAGHVSAERVTEAFLRRIAALDDAGPMLGAVIEVNPDALAIARSLDRRRRRGPVGPLHGVPVLIKASIDTADRMATSAGSLALAAHRATGDAAIVTRLRAAGAVLLGKTNMSEWANFRSTDSTSGWSSLGGQTRNPYVLDRNPCGSSSGSAVAVAARLAPFAVGTETDGSIVCPAAANGVVGIKPTVGLLSQHGIIPVAPSQDTAGPFARTVAEAGLLLAILAGEDGGIADVGAGGGDSLRGIRLGVVRDYQGAGRDPAVEAAFGTTLRSLAAAGAVLVDPVMAAPEPEAGDAELTVLLAEFDEHLAQYLATVRRGPRTLAELIEFNSAHASEVMPHFGQELLLAARLSGGTREPAYAAAVTVLARARAALAELFAAHRLDALVAPANAPAWRTDWQAGDHITVSSSRVAAVAGYPSVVVPTVLVDELPLGVAFVGKPHDESALLAIAAVAEARRGPWPAPRYLPSRED